MKEKSGRKRAAFIVFLGGVLTAVYATKQFEYIKAHGNYAQDIFVGSTQELSLSKGIKMNLLDEEYDMYFFPIFNQQTAVAWLLISDIDGTLFDAFGQSNISEWNSLNSLSENPFSLYAINGAIYAVNQSEIICIGHEGTTYDESRHNNNYKMIISSLEHADMNKKNELVRWGSDLIVE